ncbi:MAG: T9SS type A sorting domain-containing protein [Bacteroidota bacterium]
MFTGNGQHLWTVYPGGQVSYYEDPIMYGLNDWENLGLEGSVWIPPLYPDPVKEDVIYVAGGNQNRDTSTAYIYQCSFRNDSIETVQLPFDFTQLGATSLSAIEIDPTDPNRWYVASTNGRFMISDDGGVNWTVTQVALSEGQYLYGSDILIDPSDSKTIYLAGSGYSVAPVWKSTNGGLSFRAMNNGLPRTVAYGIASNEDGSMLFAATEAGPYVYIKEADQWYDMTGATAPNQNTWSVEYLEDKQVVRFGTYGRGIWDFEIAQNVSTEDIVQLNDVKVFPNPVQEVLTFESETTLHNAQIDIIGVNGQTVHSIFSDVIANQRTQFGVGHLSKGNYYLIIRNKEGRRVVPFVKM